MKGLGNNPTVHSGMRMWPPRWSDSPRSIGGASLHLDQLASNMVVVFFGGGGGGSRTRTTRASPNE